MARRRTQAPPLLTSILTTAIEGVITWALLLVVSREFPAVPSPSLPATIAAVALIDYVIDKLRRLMR